MDITYRRWIAFAGLTAFYWLTSLAAMESVALAEFQFPLWLGVGFLVFAFSSFSVIGIIASVLVVLVNDAAFYYSQVSEFGIHSILKEVIGMVLLEIVVAKWIAHLLVKRFLNPGRERPLVPLLKIYFLFAPFLLLAFDASGFYFIRNTAIWSGELLDVFFVKWLGNLIGVYFFFPIMVIYRQSPMGDRRYQAFRISIPMVLALLLTLAVFQSLHNYEHQRSSLAFSARIDSIAKEIKQLFESSIDDLDVLTSVAREYGRPNETIFRNLASKYYRNNEGIRGIAWIEPVFGRDRESLELSMRSLGYNGFQIRDLNEISYEMEIAEERSLYLPIRYIYPYLSNEQALGLDLSTHPVISETISKSLNTGRMVSSSPIRLVQSNTESLGVVFYQSVHREDMIAWDYWDPSPGSGLYSFVFDLETVFQSVIPRSLYQSSTFKLYDISEGSLPLLLTSSSHGVEAEKMRSPKVDFIEERILTIGGYTLLLEGSGDDELFGPMDHVVSFGSLGVSVFTIGFMGLYLILLFSRTLSVEEEVRRQTLELRKAKEEAEEATLAKNEFLATTNHELRTPLNGIIATAEMLLESELNQDQRGLTEMIYSSGRILHDLINDVLDYSRIEAGKLDILPIPFTFEYLINDWHAVFKVVAKNKQLEFKLETEGDLKTVLLGDTKRLNQIVINLLGNAFKFTDHGYVRLFLSLKDLGSRVAISLVVADSGIGISKEKQKHLFEAFQQGDDHSVRRYGGTGLGLAICKRLGELMGFSIRLQSELGKGTTLILEGELPITRQPVNEEQFHHPFIAPSTIDLGNTADLEAMPSVDDKPEGILVVEDNPVNRRVMDIVLKKLGRSAEFAVDGQNALELLNRNTYQLIFLDCQLPDIQGPELCRRIRSGEFGPWGKTVGVIALTANTMLENRELCFNVGMNDFLPKPINRTMIWGMLEKWMTDS